MQDKLIKGLGHHIWVETFYLTKLNGFATNKVLFPTLPELDLGLEFYSEYLDK